MTTYTFNKILFIEQMEKLIKDDQMVIVSDTIHGTVSAATKKVRGKRIPFGFSEDVFEKPETISDIMNSRPLGLILCKKDILSEKVQKEMNDYEKIPEVKK